MQAGAPRRIVLMVLMGLHLVDSMNGSIITPGVLGKEAQSRRYGARARDVNKGGG
jgi:hypothetical protein